MRLPLPINSTVTELDQDWITGGASPYSGPLFIFLLLCFYALALWDRWLNLKMRTEENRRLHAAIDRLHSYGTMAPTEPLAKKMKPVMPPTISYNVEASSRVQASDFLTVPETIHPTPPPSPLICPAPLRR